jgi:hypothetical protein
MRQHLQVASSNLLEQVDPTGSANLIRASRPQVFGPNLIQIWSPLKGRPAHFLRFELEHQTIRHDIPLRVPALSTSHPASLTSCRPVSQQDQALPLPADGPHAPLKVVLE